MGKLYEAQQQPEALSGWVSSWLNQLASGQTGRSGSRVRVRETEETEVGEGLECRNEQTQSKGPIAIKEGGQGSKSLVNASGMLMGRCSKRLFVPTHNDEKEKSL